MRRLVLVCVLAATACSCAVQDEPTDATEDQAVITEGASLATTDDAQIAAETAVEPAVTEEASGYETEPEPVADDRAPLRLRPDSLPAGFFVDQVRERRMSGTTAAIAVYGSADELLGVSRRITVSVSTGDQLGDYESYLLATQLGDNEIVDVNSVQAISSTVMPILSWVAENDTRVMLRSGRDVSSSELLAAARALQITSHEPRIDPAALPQDMELVLQEGAHPFETYTTSIYLAGPEESSGTLGALRLHEVLTGAFGADPDRDDADRFAGSRWDRVAIDESHSSVSAFWQENPDLSASANVPGISLTELKAYVDGLTPVSEEDWQGFLLVAFPRGTPMPDTDVTNVPALSVPAAADDTVWSWLERGQHLGPYLCISMNEPPMFAAEYTVALPDYQVGAGYDEIEALPKEGRRFPCE